MFIKTISKLTALWCINLRFHKKRASNFKCYFPFVETIKKDKRVCRKNNLGIFFMSTLFGLSKGIFSLTRYPYGLFNRWFFLKLKIYAFFNLIFLTVKFPTCNIAEISEGGCISNLVFKTKSKPSDLYFVLEVFPGVRESLLHLLLLQL